MKINRFRISQKADQDLEDIWVYHAQKDNLAADRLLALILDKFPMLAQFPEIGKARHELSKELRSFPVKPYVIFYKQVKDTIEIVRVLHQSRDIESLF